MVHIVSDTNAVDFAEVNTLAADPLIGSRMDGAGDQDPSKPFRGILIGLAIVTPLWVVIAAVLYLIL
jgi:hypothetical protein